MWGSFLACVIFLQSRSEPHLLRHHTLTAVLFQGDWGLGGCPLPTLPSCWCLSWCFRPAGESSLALCLRDLRCWAQPLLPTLPAEVQRITSRPSLREEAPCVQMCHVLKSLQSYLILCNPMDC